MARSRRQTRGSVKRVVRPTRSGTLRHTRRSEVRARVPGPGGRRSGHGSQRPGSPVCDGCHQQRPVGRPDPEGFRYCKMCREPAPMLDCSRCHRLCPESAFRDPTRAKPCRMCAPCRQRGSQQRAARKASYKKTGRPLCSRCAKALTLSDIEGKYRTCGGCRGYSSRHVMGVAVPGGLGGLGGYGGLTW